jgi:hypothetical protein
MTTTNKLHTIFTVGYGGRNVRAAYRELEQHMLTCSGLIIDTRKSPRSPIGLFTQASLQHHFGGYYLHVPEVGNENYNKPGEPIALTNEEEGLKKLEELLAMAPLLLLCGCTDVQRCHRRYIAEKLNERTGAPVVHLLVNGEQMNRVDKVDKASAPSPIIVPVAREQQKRSAARHVAEVEQLALFEMPAVVEQCQQNDEPAQPSDWSGQAIVQNTNPCVNLYGAGPEGRLCKDCSHFFEVLADKTYLKCDQRKLTHGAGSDHRARWSPCKKFEERSGERRTVFVSH